MISIYKLIERQTNINPRMMKLIKVKDRLNTPNKDISLNFMFMDKVVCELQLVTGVVGPKEKDKKTKSSFYNNFNHLLYELERAEFGPIAESAYIVAKYDPLISKNCDKILGFEMKGRGKKKIPREEMVVD